VRAAVVDLLAAVRSLCELPLRAPCSDAERRAAVQLHDDLRARGHEAWVETVWVRPQWALSLALHAALGVAASLAATAAPIPATAAAVAVLLSYALELAGRGGILRLLFFRRATQVVVVEAPDPDRVTLLITANTDAPRRGLVFRDGARRAAARMQRLLRGRAPGPLVWVLIALAGVAATAGARAAGAEGPVVGALQFIPTAVLLATASLALDIVLSSVSPGASDASAVAVALALHDELTERPPERLSPALALAGAGEAFPLGFQAHLRRERPDPRTTVVLEVGPAAAGIPSWTRRLGVLLALPAHPQLRIACEAAELPPHVSRRPSAAVAAVRRGIPSLTVRNLDEHGIVPRHRTPHDTPDAVDPAALKAALQACVAIVDALDAELSVVD
jgi:hypothetical protein